MSDADADAEADAVALAAYGPGTPDAADASYGSPGAAPGAAVGTCASVHALRRLLRRQRDRSLRLWRWMVHHHGSVPRNLGHGRGWGARAAAPGCGTKGCKYYAASSLNG